MGLSELLTAISNGEADENMDAVYDALKARTKLNRQMKVDAVKRQIKAGSKVSISNIRPKRLNGMIGEVVNVKRTRATLHVEGEGTANYPLSCLTPVED